MSGHDHHGHSHGGDDPPGYKRTLNLVGFIFLAVFIGCMIGIATGWLK